MKFIFLCFLVVCCFCVDYLVVKGKPYEVGYQLGNLMNKTILEMYKLKLEAYKEQIPLWERIAKSSLSYIEKYAPISYEEMKGMADAPGLNMSIISMINTEYEMEMKYSANGKKCSGFSAISTKYGVITGMNGMTIQKRVDGENSDSIIFTHHGYLTYMGMNSLGLVVEWQYIDNGERNVDGEFVPSTVVLRELLTKNSIFEAMMYLRNTPQAVCNNFMLTKHDEGVINVEMSPTNFTATYQPLISSPQSNSINLSQEICHTNTIVYSQPMMDRDICSDPTSRARYEKCRELTKKFREENGGMDLEKSKEWLFTPPIKRDGKWEGVITIAAMIFQPKERILNIKFYEDKDFRVYTL